MIVKQGAGKVTGMISIAIAEDEQEAFRKLKQYIDRYGTEHSIDFGITSFSNGMEMLQKYRPEFDIVFLDIEMPLMDGMTLARKQRKIDKIVTIIFVTNMKQYAVNGYEVSALDFIVKPVGYFDFAMKMSRALEAVESRKEVDLTVYTSQSYGRISTKDLLYVEVTGHTLIYHCISGELKGLGTMTEAEEKLAGIPFLRCNNCYLVNPRFIQMVNTNSVRMRNGDELAISRPRKKEFMAKLADWLGSGKNL